MSVITETRQIQTLDEDRPFPLTEEWELGLYDLASCYEFWSADPRTMVGVLDMERAFEWRGRKRGTPLVCGDPLYRPEAITDGDDIPCLAFGYGGLDATNNGHLMSKAGAPILTLGTGFSFAAVFAVDSDAPAAVVFGNKNGPQDGTFSTSNNTRFAGLRVGSSNNAGRIMGSLHGDDKRSIGAVDVRDGVRRMAVQTFKYADRVNTLRVDGAQVDQDTYANQDLNNISVAARSELRVGGAAQPGATIQCSASSSGGSTSSRCSRRTCRAPTSPTCSRRP
jgi:hypothetical protein